MSEKTKKYRIYSKDMGRFFEVDKETYFNYYRPIWATVKKMQRRGECCCPGNKIYTCNTICVDCEYRINNFVSLEQTICDGTISLIDYISYEKDEFNHEETSKFSPEVQDVLDSLSDTNRKICEMVSDGFSFTQIAEELNISKSSISQRFDLIKKVFAESNIRR